MWSNIIIAFTVIGFIFSGRIYTSIYINIQYYFNLVIRTGTLVEVNRVALIYTIVGIVFSTMIGIIVHQFYISRGKNG